jgi:hypothetical protein
MAKAFMKVNAAEFKRELAMQQKRIQVESGEVIAGLTAYTFFAGLLNVPQATGNYVANMVLSTTKVGSRKVEYPFPRKYDRNNPPFARGGGQAVQVAVSRNSNFKANFMRGAGAGKGAWWGPVIVIYNKMDYASVVEAGTHLRPINQPGAGAIQKMEHMLSPAFSRPIVYDTPEWHYFRNYSLQGAGK